MRFRGVFCAVLLLTSTDCAVVEARDNVRTVDNVVVFFDDDIDCYRVRDHDDYYFDDGWFYRFSDGDWFRSRAFAGPWQTVRIEVLPRHFTRWAEIRRARFEEFLRRQDQERREEWRRQEERAREEAR